VGGVLGLSLLISCGQTVQKIPNDKDYNAMLEKKIASPSDALNYFPKSVQEIKGQAAHAVNVAQEELDQLLLIKDIDRTFENTVEAFDNLTEKFSIISCVIEAIELVHPEKEMREIAHEQILKLKNFSVDAFSNKKLYEAFMFYAKNKAVNEELSKEQRYFLKESLEDFKRSGLALPQDQLDKVKELNKKLSGLTLQFSTNIATDGSTISVSRKDLSGVSDEFITSLKQDDDGKYIVGCDYPTYSELMKYCTVEETRKRLYKMFQNRAYPKNHDLLKQIITYRDELAEKLGFDSYAALDISSVMAKKIKNVDSFLADLIDRSQVKADREIDHWLADLPEGLKLDEDGKLKPWDMGYLTAYHKKKTYNIDDRKVAEYFEVEKTLNGVFDIYQKFLSLDFKLFKPEWAWHDDVQMIEVKDKESDYLRGYIMLDLYPRDNKYSHACCAPLVPTMTKDGTSTPSFSVVIANFPKATAGRPALLKHSDVETFFHEFGHAMHNLLGSTQMAGYSGCNVKWDFVEMPSQIFEEWMFDEDLLKDLSAHYETGVPLPRDQIDSLIGLKKFGSGNHVLRQCLLSRVSLDYYKQGQEKDIDGIVHDLWGKYCPRVFHDKETHFQCSFGHLMGYGAKYYGYLWSKVFALDIFYQIKQKGLLNPEAGKEFIDTILSKGGSVDPNQMLRDYLGREPKLDAFLDDLGMS